MGTVEILPVVDGLGPGNSYIGGRPDWKQTPRVQTPFP